MLYVLIMMICPLCLEKSYKSKHSQLVKHRSVVEQRTYIHCSSCHLLYRLEEERLSLEAEKDRYDEHENDLADEGYLSFLNNMWSPLKEKLHENAKGLDFGSGPNPTFAQLAARDSYEVECYDPVFASDLKLFEKEKYDFIWCNEVAEHFYEPSKEFSRMVEVLKSDGWMAIGTSCYPPMEDFFKWYYMRDETHVVFYSVKTFQWIADQLDLEYSPVSNRTHLLRKK